MRKRKPTHRDRARKQKRSGRQARAGQQTLRSEKIGALPILNHFLRRLRLEEWLQRHLPPENSRVKIPAAKALLVLLRNLLVSREPLYGIGEWAAAYAPDLLGLSLCGRLEAGHGREHDFHRRPGRSLCHRAAADAPRGQGFPRVPSRGKGRGAFSRQNASLGANVPAKTRPDPFGAYPSCLRRSILVQEGSSMIAKVTEQGVLVPKEFLGIAEEVEIHKENGVVMVVPLGEEDPILGLGRDPVICDVTDASVNHDRYLYMGY
jgi:hypothetical protein